MTLTHLGQTKSSSPTYLPSKKTFEFEVVTVNNKGQEIDRKPRQTEYFVEDLGNSFTLDMVAIPGGIFQIGSYEDINQPSIVAVAPFYMGKYPVTQSQYELLMDSNPSHFKGANHPVEQVSWFDAVEFCLRLTEKTGHSYRLPSEKEWEYACRAGTKTPFHFGETLTTDLANYRGTDFDFIGNIDSGSYGKAPKGEFREETTMVGKFPPNRFGLFDMHGNVLEWCTNCLPGNDLSALQNHITWFNDDTNFRPIRGGCWSFGPKNCRSTYRDITSPKDRDEHIGFRVVCDAP